jgi:cell division protease FtsH
MSPKTAAHVDAEIRRIIDEQYDQALAILKINRNLLEQWARELLKKEIMEGPEIDEMAKAVRPYETDRPTGANKHTSRQKAAA